MQQRQRVHAHDAGGILLDVSDADDGRQHVDMRPLAVEVGERVNPCKVALDARDVGARAERIELGVAPAAREIVDERHLLTLLGETPREMAADEAGAAEDQRAGGRAHAYPIAAYRTPAARTVVSSRIRHES